MIRILRNVLAAMLALPGAILLLAAMNVMDPRDGEEIANSVLQRALKDLRKKYDS